MVSKLVDSVTADDTLVVLAAVLLVVTGDSCNRCILVPTTVCSCEHSCCDSGSFCSCFCWFESVELGGLTGRPTHKLNDDRCRFMENPVVVVSFPGKVDVDVDGSFAWVAFVGIISPL